jgi:hypothetical protein
VASGNILITFREARLEGDGEGRPLGLGSLHLWLSMPDHRTEGLSVTGDHCLLFSEVAT